MKQRILNSFISIILISISGYSQKFEYKKLKNNSIKFIRRGLITSNNDDPYEVISAFGTAATEHKSSLINLKINDNPAIFHSCNDSIQDEKLNNKTEYLIYLNQKINLDSLFSNAVNESFKYQTYIRFEDYYTFTFNHKKFTVFRGTERRFFRNVLYHHLVLFEIENDKIISAFAFLDCPEESLNCFGDFNFDGNLDYVDWTKNNNRISLYSLDSYKFKKQKFYIIVKPTTEEKKNERNNDYLFNYSLIDRKKTKWFYGL